MTILFTKTCARDAKRAFYQAHAARRLLRGYSHHLVMIEQAELDRVPQLLALQQIGVHVVTVEKALPQLLRVEAPYLRQQLCKLWAPVEYGEDMVQIDSDMCPQLELNLTEVFGTSARPIWCYRSAPMPILESTIKDWRESASRAVASATRHHDVDPWSAAVATSRRMPLHSYMLEQHGWFVKQEVADELVARLDIAKIRGRFSEYQTLGWFARRYYESAYSWHDVTMRGPRAVNKTWVLHATSAEPIDHVENKLVELAGGVRWPAA